MKNYKQKTVDSEAKVAPQDPPSVTKYMTRKLITFSPDTQIKEVVESLLSNRITGAPVLDDKGRVVGLIDDKDCLKVDRG